MKRFIIFGWFEYPNGDSSARGGMNDVVLDGDSKIVSFATEAEAKQYLDAGLPPSVNVAQICDMTTGVFHEFGRTWTPRQPKPPKPPKQPPKQPPTNPPNTNAAGGGGGNP